MRSVSVHSTRSCVLAFNLKGVIIVRTKSGNPNQLSPFVRWADQLDTLTVAGTLTKTSNLLGVDVPEDAWKHLSNFVIQISDTIARIPDAHSTMEFYKACKRRYDLLYAKLSQILDYWEDDCWPVLQRHDGKHLFHVGKDTTVAFECEYDASDSTINRIYLVGGVNPACYLQLYKAIADWLEYNCTQTEDSEIVKSEFRKFAELILTYGKVYELFRSCGKLIELQEEQSLDRLNIVSKPMSPELTALLTSVISDISLGRKAPPYVRDLSDIKRRFKPDDYTEEDYHVSFRSTGTKYRGSSIPGLFAAMIETDPLVGCKFDQITGYESLYNTEPTDGCLQYNRKTVTIDQHKLDRRVIHMTSNPIQDRCNYYHRRLNKILRSVPADCTFDQQKGVNRAMLATAPGAIAENHWNIYSLDLSKATDTLSKEYQEACLALFFGTELAEIWTQLVTGEQIFCFADKSEHPFTPKRGQPQGYKSSFPAFALAHHMLMRLVMKACHLEEMQPEDFYRVLGDDSLITVVDPDLSIRDTYIHLCDEVGWECHKDKGYTYIYGESPSATAEFAKVRVRDGETFTAVPITLISNLSTNKKGAYLALTTWYSLRKMRLTAIEADDKLQSLGCLLTQEEFNSLFYCIEMGLGEFNSYLPSGVQLEPETEYQVISAYFLSKLNNCLLQEWLPSHLVGRKQYQKDYDPFIGTRYEDELLNLIQDPDANKYMLVIENNERLIKQLDRVFGERTIHQAVSRFELTPEEQSTILDCCELLITDRIGHSNPTGFIIMLDQALKIVNKYNPRKLNDSISRDCNIIEHLGTKMAQVGLSYAIM